MHVISNSIVTRCLFCLPVLILLCGNAIGLIFFDHWPLQERENECEIDFHCRSNKCITRTDFFCAARSKLLKIKYYVYYIAQRGTYFYIFRYLFYSSIQISLATYLSIEDTKEPRLCLCPKRQ